MIPPISQNCESTHPEFGGPTVSLCVIRGARLRPGCTTDIRIMQSFGSDRYPIAVRLRLAAAELCP